MHRTMTHYRGRANAKPIARLNRKLRDRTCLPILSRSIWLKTNTSGLESSVALFDQSRLANTVCASQLASNCRARFIQISFSLINRRARFFIWTRVCHSANNNCGPHCSATSCGVYGNGHPYNASQKSIVSEIMPAYCVYRTLDSFHRSFANQFAETH